MAFVDPMHLLCVCKFLFGVEFSIVRLFNINIVRNYEQCKVAYVLLNTRIRLMQSVLYKFEYGVYKERVLIIIR